MLTSSRVAIPSARAEVQVPNRIDLTQCVLPQHNIPVKDIPQSRDATDEKILKDSFDHYKKVTASKTLDKKSKAAAFKTVGYYYFFGFGCERNVKQGFKNYYMAAEFGNISAQLDIIRYTVLTSSTKLVDAIIDKRIENINRFGTEVEIGELNFYLSILYLDTDPQRAKQLCQESSEQGYAEASYIIGNSMGVGLDALWYTFEKNHPRALQFLELAIAQDPEGEFINIFNKQYFPLACYHVGVGYWEGCPEKNREKATQYFRKAIDNIQYLPEEICCVLFEYSDSILLKSMHELVQMGNCSISSDDTDDFEDANDADDSDDSEYISVMLIQSPIQVQDGEMQQAQVSASTGAGFLPQFAILGQTVVDPQSAFQGSKLQEQQKSKIGIKMR